MVHSGRLCDLLCPSKEAWIEDGRWWKNGRMEVKWMMKVGEGRVVGGRVEEWRWVVGEFEGIFSFCSCLACNVKFLDSILHTFWSFWPLFQFILYLKIKL